MSRLEITLTGDGLPQAVTSGGALFGARRRFFVDRPGGKYEARLPVVVVETVQYGFRRFGWLLPLVLGAAGLFVPPAVVELGFGIREDEVRGTLLQASVYAAMPVCTLIGAIVGARLMWRARTVIDGFGVWNELIAFRVADSVGGQRVVRAEFMAPAEPVIVLRTSADRATCEALCERLAATFIAGRDAVFAREGWPVPEATDAAQSNAGNVGLVVSAVTVVVERGTPRRF